MQVSDLYLLELYDFYVYMACQIFVLNGNQLSLSLFLVKVIAKLKGHYVLHTKTRSKHKTLITMRTTINNVSTAAEASL